MISFSNVNPISKSSNKSILNQLKKIIKKNDFILGKNTEKFEKRFTKYEKFKYGIGCSSGTDALTLAIRSLDLKDNDEIILPGLSYISTLYSPLLVNKNFKIKFVDVDIKTGLMDIQILKKKISRKTKAVIVVNLYGQKLNLKNLNRIKQKFKFKIIEDSAQSHGALIYKKSKNYSDLACYSFYPSKNLGAYGDAGFICTDNKKLYQFIKLFRSVGSKKKNVHTILGSNSRIDNLQCTILNIKLNSLNKWNKKRREIANIYNKNLKNIKKIKLLEYDKSSIYHLYVIRVKTRSKFIKYMGSKKIECGCHYPYTLYKNYEPKLKLKNSETLSRECVSLPMHPNLTNNEINKVINAIKQFK